MKSKTAGYIGGGLLATALVFGAGEAQAVQPDYKSLKAAGITVEQFERNKKQGKYIMPEKDHWSGKLEAGESFDDFVDGLQKWAEEFYARTFNKRRFKNAVENYAKERKIVTPEVGALCKSQLEANYMRELEIELEVLEDLYNSMEKDMERLKSRYAQHDKRIADLEKRPVPEQKDYTEDLDQLKKEIQYLREERESFTSSDYAQPPAEEGQAVAPGYSGITEIYGEPSWFVGIPYPYRIRGGYIEYWYTPIGGIPFWRPWGWLDYDNGFYYARGFDGRAFHYRGHTTDLPLLKRHWDHHRPDGRHWKHPSDQHRRDPRQFERRGREHPRDRGCRLDDRGRRDIPRSELPRTPRTYGPAQGRPDSRRLQQGGFQRNHVNPQFNQRQARPSVPQHNFQRGSQPPVMQHSMPQGGSSRGGSFSGQQRSFGNQGGQQSGASFRGGPKVNMQAPGSGIRGRGPR